MKNLSKNYFIFLMVLVFILSIIFQQLGKYFEISNFITIPVFVIVYVIILLLFRNRFN